MGHGIAQVSALAGFKVALYDSNARAIERALAKIRENYDKGISRGRINAEERDEALGRLATAESVEAAVSDAGLAIEAVVEDMEAKKALFAEIDRHAPPEAILATNTSSLAVGEIADATSRPERVIGMHFFNPVHVMQLLEIVVHDRTEDEVRETVLRVARRLGKEPIVVRDVPGFASSRLGIVLGLEAMRMLEQGVASAEDIDKAMVLGYNHPMGPLRLTDLVGLDVRLKIAEYLYQELKSEAFRPPEILKQKVAERKLGKKTLEGFYKWEN
jgi:3-hydroxybutyryl-CoA dehydrogenase